MKYFKNYQKIDELNSMIKKINEQRLTTTIYPPKEQVFRVFDLALEDIKSRNFRTRPLS